MEKYYTPTIEEFHVGFEYHRMYWDGSWGKEVLTEDDMEEIESEQLPNLRVKYLDRSDIESLGWGLKPEGCFGQSDDGEELFTFYIKEEYTMLHTSENILRVFKSNQIGQLACLFNGTIKNKSELKQVLKMIGI
jgi:hypothetical protein